MRLHRLECTTPNGLRRLPNCANPPDATALLSVTILEVFRRAPRLRSSCQRRSVGPSCVESRRPPGFPAVFARFIMRRQPSRVPQYSDRTVAATAALGHLRLPQINGGIGQRFSEFPVLGRLRPATTGRGSFPTATERGGKDLGPLPTDRLPAASTLSW